MLMPVVCVAVVPPHPITWRLIDLLGQTSEKQYSLEKAVAVESSLRTLLTFVDFEAGV